MRVYGWDSGLLTLDGLIHLILPSFSLASIMLPLFIRLIRSEMMEILETEYIKFAWAKGLAPRRVWLLHAFEYIFSGSCWITFFPGILLVVFVLVINLLGDWLRDVLNPKLYNG